MGSSRAANQVLLAATEPATQADRLDGEVETLMARIGAA